MPRPDEYVSVSLPVELANKIKTLHLPLNPRDQRRRDSLGTRVEILLNLGIRALEARPAQADLTLYTL